MRIKGVDYWAEQRGATDAAESTDPKTLLAKASRTGGSAGYGVELAVKPLELLRLH